MHPEIRYWLIVIGSSLMSLLCAIPNAFNTISDKFQADTKGSNEYVALVSGFGVAGLQLTLIGGIILDKYGPVVASVVGGIFVIVFNLAMSWTHSPAGLLIEMFLMSLGSGCSFLAALSTTIAIGRPLGIGLVSLAMSLSITCTVGITKIYKNMPIGCVDGAGCWRNYMRVYAICCAVLYTIGTLALAFYQRPRALNREESVTRKDGMHASLLTDVAAGSNDVEALVDKEFGGVPVFGGPAASSQNTRSYSTGATRTSSTNSANGQGSKRSASTGAHASGYSSYLLVDPASADVEVKALLDDEPNKSRQTSVHVVSIGGREVDIVNEQVTFLQSLVVFKEVFFWSLFYGYLCGIACGILVITSAKQEWEEFNKDPSKDSWSQNITVAFSVCSASTNVLSPLISTFLHEKKIMSRAKYLVVILSFSSVVFMILGIMVSVHQGRHEQSDGTRGLFAALMALAGVGFGTFLTVFPTLLGDVFGHVNFGTFMSYMQLGAAAFAIIVPIVAASVKSATGSFKGMYFAMMAMLALAAIGMALPKAARQQ